jgi:ABC-type thiamin/hydroxymethylpyrimidine transport system permease subunit
LQLPGHSGIFWMAIIIVGSQVVPKPGSASLIGVISGLLAAFLGMGDHGGLNTLLSYSVIGFGTDLALWLLRKPENLFIAGLIGVIGHFGKFLVKWAFGAISGAPVGFVALGLTKAIIGYIIFGAIGGVLGGLTLIALRKAGYFKYLQEKI